MTPQDRHEALSDLFPGSVSTEGKGFGSRALKTNGKIFAMLVQDRLVVKLPRIRVDESVSSGAGERFENGGRIMKEWLVVASASNADWETFAREAHAFVSGQL